MQWLGDRGTFHSDHHIGPTRGRGVTKPAGSDDHEDLRGIPCVRNCHEFEETHARIGIHTTHLWSRCGNRVHTAIGRGMTKGVVVMVLESPSCDSTSVQESFKAYHSLSGRGDKMGIPPYLLRRLQACAHYVNRRALSVGVRKTEGDSLLYESSTPGSLFAA